MVSSLVFISRNCVNAAPLRYMRRLPCSVSQAHSWSLVGYVRLILLRIIYSQPGPKVSHSHLRHLYRTMAVSLYGPVMSTRWLNQPHPFMRRSSLVSLIICGFLFYCVLDPSLEIIAVLLFPLPLAFTDTEHIVDV